MSPRRGFVLIMVLVVVLLASMVVTSLLFVLTTEQTAAAAGARGAQVRAAAMSGVCRGLTAAVDAASGAIQWQDNPGLFRDQLVCDDGAQKWYYSIYSVSDSGDVRFGLTDEASKLNIYHATEPMLEALPNLTPPLAQGLLSALAAGGGAAPPADTNQAAAAAPAMQAPTPARPWTCLDELLQVSGFTVPLLYGSYTNLAGRSDSQAQGLAAVLATDDAQSQAQGGLRQVLTVSSYDPNLDNDGHPRIDLNGGDLSTLGLAQESLDFIKALRQSGVSMTNVGDLLTATVKSKDPGGKQAPKSSGIAKEDLPTLLDRCTTATNQAKLIGLVNLNTASAQVLAALPGLNATLAEAIVSARVGLSPEAAKTPAWLYQEGIVNADAFQQASPFLTTRGYQFRFRVAAYAIPAGSYCVLEAVVDAAAKPPALLLLRDVSRLGLPFSPNLSPDQQGPGLASQVHQPADGS